MTYEEATQFMVTGDPVQRGNWPETRMLSMSEDGTLHIYDAQTEEQTAYEPTTGDMAATDWLLVA